MTTFGDADPEDAYDASDPPLDRVAVLERVVFSIRAERYGHATRDAARTTKAVELLSDLAKLKGEVGVRAAAALNELGPT